MFVRFSIKWGMSDLKLSFQQKRESNLKYFLVCISIACDLEDFNF